MWFGVFFTLLFSTQLFASSLGILEYSKSPKEIDHSALIYTRDKEICYSVCQHNQEISAKCAENKSITFCVSKSGYLDLLITGFGLETYFAKVKQHQQYELNIKKFRDAIEVNRQRGIKNAKQEADLTLALKEADVLFNDISEIKKTTSFQNYQALYSTLTDEDDSMAVGLSVDKLSNWDQWRIAVAPFWFFREQKLCGLALKAPRDCVLHLNGDVVGVTTAAKASDCQTLAVQELKLSWKNSANRLQPFSHLLKQYCSANYFEIRELARKPLATIPPANPNNPVIAKTTVPTPKPAVTPALQIPPKTTSPTDQQDALAKAKNKLYESKVSYCKALLSDCFKPCSKQFFKDLESGSTAVRAKAVERGNACDAVCLKSYERCMDAAKLAIK